ncbi:MAG: signal peptidase II [Planctomycetia bacterium]|jgi:signal peptidase II
MKKVPASRYLVFFAIVMIGCVADLWSKSYMFSWLGMPLDKPPEESTYWIIDGVCGFQTSLNEGGLFGLAQGAVHWFAIFAGIAFVAILFWLFFLGAARSWLLTISLGCIGSGTLGNMYDRLGMPGLKWNYAIEGLHQIGDPVFAVRDFVRIVIMGWTWPNFNLADSLLVCGAILLGIHAFFYSTPPKNAEDTEEAGNETESGKASEETETPRE